MTRRSMLFLVALAALTLSLAPTHAQQRQAPPAGGQMVQAEPPPEPATGLILGRVIDGDTGSPVSGAIVSTTIPGFGVRGAPGAPPPPPPPPRLVGTNGDGEFVFTLLPRGSYMLTATAPGYSAGQSGQRRIGGPAQPIPLQTGQRVGDVTIRLWKYGVITGTVVDDAGDPSVGTQVRIMRVTFVGSQKRLTSGNFTSTDDRGIYRASGLLPGEYVVSVPQIVTSLPSETIEQYLDVRARAMEGPLPADGSPPQAYLDLQRSLSEAGVPQPASGVAMRVGDQQILAQGRPPALLQSGNRLAVFPTTYYNSTESAADAAVVTLTSGQERSGVDVQIRPVAAASVSGRIVGPDGPAINQGVRLVPMAAAALGLDSGYEQATTATDATGAFTFPAVPLGAYMLRASRIPHPDPGTIVQAFVDGNVVSTAFSPIAGRSGLPSRDAQFAEQALAIDRNLTNVAVTMSPGYHATGRFVFQGSAPPPGPEILQRMQVSLVSAEGRPAPGLAPGTSVTPEGRFTSARYQPGRMFINVVVGANIAPYRLQSVMLGGKSHDAEPFDLTSGDLDGLTIMFTDAPTSLEVAVPNAPAATSSPAGAQSTPGLDAVLLVIPADYMAWLNGGMAPRVSVTASLSGSRYTASGLPPGDYIAAVISSGVAAMPHDVAFYQSIARAGTRVSLGPGDHRSLDLAVADIR